ncbi:N-acetyltransferase [Oscillatoria sp. FACHB-1407]|uniref:GNAT family N-acetyltransferase n=1 Tax=Oscillatoria sp. FACHB-1407 TaxID=2692847 RepID=UPI001688C614|nr:GNAT family N-acetyltransferase [Oscillatoria sp. FACHB-1407]MBD2461393.1 N-acetyltransferase [Oscillatoria sp. FACHB-1407]
MALSPTFRPATLDDCDTIAQLFQIASDGVCDYIWSTLREEYPGLTPLEIGAQRYANPDNPFGYKNCVLAEQDGAIAGMMVTFATDPAEEASQPDQPESLAESDRPTEEPAAPDILAPYSLEAPNTWYICALALFPAFRGQGTGTQFLKLAHQQAVNRGFSSLSLLCFEQNVGALRLYLSHGFQVIDRTPVVPHPLIHYTGDLLLMTAAVKP